MNRSMNLFHIGVLVSVGLVFWGCSTDGSDAADAGSDTRDFLDDVESPDVVIDVEQPDSTSNAPLPAITITVDAVAQNPANSLSYYVLWRTDTDVPTALRVVCGDIYDHTFGAPTPTQSHEVFVMGLWDGASCALTIEAEAEGFAKTTASTVIEGAGPLPSQFPVLDVKVMDLERMQRGWTLWSVAGAETPFDRAVVAVDEHGRYRWYYQPGSSQQGAGDEIHLVDDGRAIMLGAADPQQIIDWEGNVLFDLVPAAHHDTQLSPWNPRHILYFGASDVNCNGTTEHTIHELNMDTGEVVWTWRACDHITPRINYWNWSHLNTIEPFPNERALLISSRNQDALWKINRDTDEVEWVFGLDGDFELDRDAWFFRQHASQILENGDILLFDNGLTHTELELLGDPLDWERLWSRAIQYRLHFKNDGTPDRAEVVWEYTDMSIFAENRSDVDRLPNGNTLLHYVWVHPDLRVRMREVTMDGDVVWDVLTPADIASYRAERVEPYLGHTR